MRYIKFTYIDAVTGAPVTDAPSVNGPAFPPIEGLEFAWARESRYPTDTPEFFGICPDDADIDAPGVLGDLSPGDWSSALTDEVSARQVQITASNNTAYEQAVAKMTSGYPPSEIATWERQRAEALAWEAGSAAPTPWIDLAASARGLDRNEYLTRTLLKVKAFAQASAWLTGRRQGIDDAIRAASTLEQLKAITIDYTLPGAHERTTHPSQE